MFVIHSNGRTKLHLIQFDIVRHTSCMFGVRFSKFNVIKSSRFSCQCTRFVLIFRTCLFRITRFNYSNIYGVFFTFGAFNHLSAFCDFSRMLIFWQAVVTEWICFKSATTETNTQNENHGLKVEYFNSIFHFESNISINSLNHHRSFCKIFVYKEYNFVFSFCMKCNISL